MGSFVATTSADREVWRQARSQINDAENEMLELQLDVNERQAAVDALQARHKSLNEDVSRFQQKKAAQESRSKDEMKRILVAHKAIKEEVQHQEELLNLHKGLTEQLTDAVEIQSKQRTLFADHVMQQGSYVQEVKHFLEGLSSCKEHPSETSTDATISMNA